MERLFKAINIFLVSSAVSTATFVIAIFIAIFILLNVESSKYETLKKKAALPKGSISDISAALPKSSQEILPEPTEPTDEFSKYLKAVKALESLTVIESDLVKSPAINICEIICDPTHFKMSQKDFLTFYNDEGRKAFEDPEFRLQLESLFLVKELFPAETLQTISSIKDYRAESSITLSQQLALSLKIEGKVLREIYTFSRRGPVFLKKNNNLKFMKGLRKQCSVQNVNELKATCEKNSLGV
jgi:hypothetical protein